MEEDVGGVCRIFECLKEEGGELMEERRGEGLRVFGFCGVEKGDVEVGVIVEGERVGGEVEGWGMFEIRMRGEDGGGKDEEGVEMGVRGGVVGGGELGGGEGGEEGGKVFGMFEGVEGGIDEGEGVGKVGNGRVREGEGEEEGGWMRILGKDVWEGVIERGLGDEGRGGVRDGRVGEGREGGMR